MIAMVCPLNGWASGPACSPNFLFRRLHDRAFPRGRSMKVALGPSAAQLLSSEKANKRTFAG
jgi:hypothetical protein